MKELKMMPFFEFCRTLKDYLQLCQVIEKVTCPQILIVKRDELKDELRESFSDHEDNLSRWQKGEPCTFVHPENKNRVEIDIGRDITTLYQFLAFCYEITMTGRVNEERKAHLAYLISRKGDGNAD